MRVVINISHGGFSISWMGRKLLRINSKYPENEDFGYEAEDENGYKYRTDPILILSMMCLGAKKIGGTYSNLKIVEIPDNINWGIGEYDGSEHIYEAHNTWS